MIATTKKTAADLSQMYLYAESVDADIFAEQRSNILLYAGDHYTRRNSRFNKRLREQKEVAQEQKLRLVKNHTQYICDTYVNNIISSNPGVGFSPKNDKEMHDQKVAEMHHAVWRDAHDKYDIDEKIDDWVESFVQVGEVCVKIYFDPSKGPIKAYPQKENDTGPVFLHPYTGETSSPVDEQGAPLQPAPDEENPIYAGEYVFEEVYGFNLLRPPECKDIRKASWLGIRKMVDKKDLDAQFPGKKDYTDTTQDKTYIVFDTTRGGYTQVRDQVLVTEYYFRSCPEYPNGYYYIATPTGILDENELPGGVFPLVFQAFRRFPTTPRGRSPIKTMRPYQAEINRSASKIAEHQITLGDDKLLIQNGTKISAGIALPGVRSINFTGMDPKILNGRSGEQYTGYMQGQIEEMYRVMGVAEDMEDLPAQLDPYTLLFRSARQKKKFQRYIKRFEVFLINVVKTYLQLAKVHMTDDTLIRAIGSMERVNVPEFRSSADIHYEVKIEAQSEDIETKLGKQISISHILQYVGPQMKPEQIGKLMRQLPYGNLDDSFDDFTLNYDNSVNDILALDRGEQPPINQYEDHEYQIGRLTNRMKKGDFRYLAPQIQQSYASKVQLHEQFAAQKLQAIQRAQQGLIPTTGGLVKCDVYVPGKTPDANPMRATVPTDALRWLLAQIDAQESGLAPILGMPDGAQAEVANEFTRMTGGQHPNPLMGGSPTPQPGMGSQGPGTRMNPLAMPRAHAMAR